MKLLHLLPLVTCLHLPLLAADTPAAFEDHMFAMFELSVEPIRRGGPFDFGASDLPLRMRDAGLALAAERAHLRLPPVETMFLQRKFGGIYLLASRLGARVDLRAIVEPWL